MSDAHPSLIIGCLYKQTAIYYFIGVSYILTSSPTLGHDPGSIDEEWKRTLPGISIPNMKSF